MKKLNSIAAQHVTLALAAIDRSGIPARRRSTRYELLSDGRAYPPKLVLATAYEIATGERIDARDFSGGTETNSLLTKLGFQIISRHPAPVPRATFGTVIAAVGRDVHESERLDATLQLVRAFSVDAARPVVLSFSGGWFKAGNTAARTMIDRLLPTLVDALAKSSGRVALTFGVDGYGDREQLAAAVTKDGLVALARKFHPAPGEERTLRAASSWNEEEQGCSRVAELFGRRAYLAVCYDSFGIKRLGIEPPPIDLVIDHVHSFRPVGDGQSGDVLFARHGLAGAACAWRVPVLAAVRFVDRPIPPTWPSGVVWEGKPRSTTEWTYADNSMVPEQTRSFATRAGRLQVRLFAV